MALEKACKKRQGIVIGQPKDRRPFAGVSALAPRGWNKTGTSHGYVSLELLRAFARAYPSVKLVYGHEAGRF